MKKIVIIICLYIGMVQSAYAEKVNINIVSGIMDGVYYSLATAICKIVNLNDPQNTTCLAIATSGSVYNVNQLEKHQANLMITQLELLREAYNGTNYFKDNGPSSKIRVLMGLHYDNLNIIVTNNSQIKKLSDLKGKRIDMGSLWSGTNHYFHLLMRYLKWKDEDFSTIVEYTSTDAICNDKVDALVFVGGEPNSVIQEILNNCDTKLISIEGPEVDQLIKENPDFTKVAIPSGTYGSADLAVNTIATRAMLSTSSDVSDDVVRSVLTSIFNHFDIFSHSHPAFINLNLNDMVESAINSKIPLHEEAIKFYKEKKLLK